MDLGTLLAFWAVSLMFVITPGPDWAYAITAGMKERALVPAAAGLLLGHFAATLLVATGVGTLMARTPLALGFLTMGGVAYLLWIGINLLIHPPTPSSGPDQGPLTWPQWMVRGFAVSGLNPKVFLLFLALLPQFTDPAASFPVSGQIMILGLIHISSCSVVYSAVGLASGKILRTRSDSAKVVGRISGCVMIIFALLMASEIVLPLFR